MSRILLYDETAGSERFSSDSSKNANIGSGTGSARISISVTAFMAPGPTLSPGRCVPLSVKPTEGSQFIEAGAPAVISTGLSREPLVCVTDGFAATAKQLDENDPTGHSCISFDKTHGSFLLDEVRSDGRFFIHNDSDPDPTVFGTCPGASGTASYCYL